MHRNIRFALAIVFFAASPAFAAKKKPAAAPPSITVDTHADTPTEWMEHPFDLGVLNTRGHFGAPMFAPIVNNVVVIVGCIVFIAVEHSPDIADTVKHKLPCRLGCLAPSGIKDTERNC